MPDNELVEGLQPPQAPTKPSDAYPTRELGRLLKAYKERVRDYHYTESQGVIKNIQRMIDKGIEFADIAQALDNYAKDEWRLSQGPARSHPVRTFFCEAKIKEWINPPPRSKTTTQARPALPQVAFVALERPKPVIPQDVILLPFEEDDEL
jgi:hypothetical protein